jgi:hypothetical protein
MTATFSRGIRTEEQVVDKKVRAIREATVTVHGEKKPTCGATALRLNMDLTRVLETLFHT